MPNSTDNTGSSSLLSSITRMLDTSISAGGGLDNTITVLSLLCLFSIMNRTHAIRESQQNPPAANSNPLHKLLGDLTKGGDGGGSGVSPDTLMSLLPLLNSPQLKSKLNPSTMGTVLGLLNNLGGLGGSTPPEKPKAETKSEPKIETSTESLRQPKESEPPTVTPQTAPTPKQPLSPQENEDSEEAEGKNNGRYLNWKNNF